MTTKREEVRGDLGKIRLVVQAELGERTKASEKPRWKLIGKMGKSPETVTVEEREERGW